MAPPRPVLYVDAASYYFVKGYEKAPEKCNFTSAASAQMSDASRCLEETLQSPKLPPGWVDEKEVPKGSQLREGYRLVNFRTGVLFSAVKHSAILPRALDPNAVNAARKSIETSGKISVPLGELQAEYERRVQDVHQKEEQLLAKWESLDKSRKDPKNRSDVEALERERHEVKNELARKKLALWEFLIWIEEQRIPIALMQP